MDAEEGILDLNLLICKHHLELKLQDAEEKWNRMRIEKENLEEELKKQKDEVERMRDEECAHCKAKSTGTTLLNSTDGVNDLDLNALRNRHHDIMDGIVDTLEKENEDLRMENVELKCALERESEKLEDAERKLNRVEIDKGKLEGELKVQKEKNDGFVKELRDLAKSNNELMGSFQSERDELKIELREQSEKVADFEERNRVLRLEYSCLEKCHEVALESIASLNSEKSKLKTQLESEKSKDYETRLKEHREEVERLRKSKEEVIKRCQYWIVKCRQMIDKLLPIMKKKNPVKYALEVIEIEWVQKSTSQQFWWERYNSLSSDLSKAFEWIQELRRNPDSVPESIFSIRKTLLEVKQAFDENWQILNRSKWPNEWVEKELSLKYFETLDKLIMETEKRINNR